MAPKATQDRPKQPPVESILCKHRKNRPGDRRLPDDLCGELEAAEFFPDFIPALIRLAAELGALRLDIYYIDGVPAATQFWILWHGRAGTLLSMEMTERVLADDHPREITLGAR